MNYTHVNKKGEVDVVAGWANNGHRQVQCAFGCNSNNFVLGAAAIALDSAADAAATVVLAVVTIALLAGIIADAVTSASSMITAYTWVNKPTEDEKTVKVRKLTNDEVSELEEFGQSLEEIKLDEVYPPNSDIYVDKNGDYWIQPPREKFFIPFPS